VLKTAKKCLGDFLFEVDARGESVDYPGLHPLRVETSATVLAQGELSWAAETPARPAQTDRRRVYSTCRPLQQRQLQQK
jgi:hypothetical protein